MLCRAGRSTSRSNSCAVLPLPFERVFERNSNACIFSLHVRTRAERNTNVRLRLYFRLNACRKFTLISMFTLIRLGSHLSIMYPDICPYMFCSFAFPYSYDMSLHIVILIFHISHAYVFVYMYLCLCAYWIIMTIAWCYGIDYWERFIFQSMKT